MEEFQWMLENYKALNNLMQTNVICCEDHLNHEKLFVDGCGELQSLLTTFRGLNFQVESVITYQTMDLKIISKNCGQLKSLEESKANHLVTCQT